MPHISLIRSELATFKTMLLVFALRKTENAPAQTEIHCLAAYFTHISDNNHIA